MGAQPSKTLERPMLLSGAGSARQDAPAQAEVRVLDPENPFNFGTLPISLQSPALGNSSEHRFLIEKECRAGLESHPTARRKTNRDSGQQDSALRCRPSPIPPYTTIVFSRAVLLCLYLAVARVRVPLHNEPFS
jgi:hypothetical protein